MKNIILSLLIVLFLFAGLAEAKIYKYKYQFVLVANTDGQAATSFWNWNEWKKDWVPSKASSSMEVNESTDVNIIMDTATNACNSTNWDLIIMDTATNACNSTNWDLNLTHAIVSGGVYSTTTHYYSLDDETKDTIESLPGGLEPPLGFIKPTIDEDSGLTCTIDIYFAVERM
jgi:hypothetical protein